MFFFFFSGIQVSFVIEVSQILCEDGKPDESESVDLRRRRKCSCSESPAREVQGCRWEKWGKMAFVEVSFIFLLFSCGKNNQRDCTSHLIYAFQFYFLLFAYLCTDWAHNIQCKHSHILHSNCFFECSSELEGRDPPFLWELLLSSQIQSCVLFFPLSILDQTWDNNNSTPKSWFPGEKTFVIQSK